MERYHGSQGSSTPVINIAQRKKDRLVVYVHDLDLHPMRKILWNAIRKANQKEPRLFLYGDSLCRLERDEKESLHVRPLDLARMRQEITDVAILKRQTRNSEYVVVPRRDLVEDVLVMENPPLPRLKRIVRVPCFSRHGSIIDSPGYHPNAEIYYQPEEALALPPVPPIPLAEDIAEAKRIIGECLCDFPFEGAADYSHAVALLLLPSVRELIRGANANTCNRWVYSRQWQRFTGPHHGFPRCWVRCLLT